MIKQSKWIKIMHIKHWLKNQANPQLQKAKRNRGESINQANPQFLILLHFFILNNLDHYTKSPNEKLLNQLRRHNHKPFDWTEPIEDSNKNQKNSELYLSLLFFASSRTETADSIRLSSTLWFFHRRGGHRRFASSSRRSPMIVFTPSRRNLEFLSSKKNEFFLLSFPKPYQPDVCPQHTALLVLN